MTDVQDSTREEKHVTEEPTSKRSSLSESKHDTLAEDAAHATIQTPSGVIAAESPLAQALAKASAEAAEYLAASEHSSPEDVPQHTVTATLTQDIPVAAATTSAAPETQTSGNGAIPPPPPSGDAIAFFAEHYDAELHPETETRLPAPAPEKASIQEEEEEEEEEEEKIPSEEKPMTLMGHLGELRTRLVRCAIAVGIVFVGCYSVAERLFEELCRPLVAALPEGSKLIFTALPEAFFVYLQVGFVAALFVASPYIFYQIWAFIAPGLYDEEKRFIVPLAACSASFFILGAIFCFMVVFPFAFTFFLSFANESIAAMPSLSEYLGFALKLLIAFGLIFEMPLFSFFLSRMGIISANLMRKARRYAILAIFIVAAILTPPDVMSQMLMAMPMLILYEISIWVAAAFGRKKKTTKERNVQNNETSKHTAATQGEQA